MTAELDRISAERGRPIVLRSDNGPEFACHTMEDWAGQTAGLWFIPPGKPWKNPFIEAFNGRLRDECLNINEFWSLTQARMTITDWKRCSRMAFSVPFLAVCVPQLLLWPDVATETNFWHSRAGANCGPADCYPAPPCQYAYAASAAVNAQVLAATAAESWLETPAACCGLMLLF